MSSEKPDQTAALKPPGILARVVWLLQNGNASEAAGLCKVILNLAPENFHALYYYGVAAVEEGNPVEAIASYERALAIHPDSPDVHNSIGDALGVLGRHEEAITSYKRALAIRPDYSEARISLGSTLGVLQRHEEAITVYSGALEFCPDSPWIHYNFGNALWALRRHEEAITCYKRALELHPDFPDAHNNLGNILGALKRHEEAITSYRDALALRPDFPGAHCNLGNTLGALGRHEEAIDSYRRVLELYPDFGDTIIMLADQQRKICDWHDFDDLQQALMVRVASDKEPLLPFYFLAFSDDPADQLLCARRYAKKKVERPGRLPPLAVRDISGPVRVAYLSGDFHEHATSYLMAEMFEMHDRERFEVHAISFGPDRQDAMRSRLVGAFDHFHDVRNKSDQEIATLIRTLGIHIAVDLKGYTGDSRPSILAYRPAPVQVNYLGYPGTMGASFMDYILVDPFIVPADQQAFFTEQLVFLPNCYQVNDSQRKIAEDIPSRSACGLPDSSFVFCCFNNNYKITPVIFDVWMRLLDEIPGSVLWLLKDNSAAERNLRREAGERGVDAERLVFAPKVALPHHLARQKQADLFLDTFPYNAHTTASDALWAGLPVLTCAGRSFASRVAGSLLNNVGLPELVMPDLERYEAMALKLARDPELLGSYRRKLAENRDNSPLFDCERFTRDLEAAYRVMFGRWKKGWPPEHFTIADIA